MKKFTYQNIEEIADVVKDFFIEQKKIKMEEELMFKVKKEEKLIFENSKNTNEILFDMVDNLYSEDKDQDF